MRGLAVLIFFLGLVVNFWCGWKASKHRKDPTIPVYVGNVTSTGRKYMWACLVALVASMVAVIFFSKS